MKQTTFEAQAFLEAVQFFRQEKEHYGSWEMITGDEVQVTRAQNLSVCVLEVSFIINNHTHKNGRCGSQGHFSHCLEAFGPQTIGHHLQTPPDQAQNRAV